MFRANNLRLVRSGDTENNILPRDLFMRNELPRNSIREGVKQIHNAVCNAN